MSIFDGNSTTQTELAIGLGAHDYALRNLGALNLAAMTDPGALPPTNGVDCKLVHGDFFQHIELAGVNVLLTTMLYGDEKKTVSGKRTAVLRTDDETVREKATYTLGERELHVLGDDKIINDGHRDITVSDKDTETYASPRHIDEPEHFETALADLGWKTFIVELCGTKAEACLTLHLEIKDLHVAVEVLEHTGKAISNKLAFLASKIPVLGSRVAALDVKMATRINGAPTESTTAPIMGA